MKHNKFRFLIVDNEMKYRKLYYELLKELDVIEDIAFAADGTEALKLIETFKPNALITELLISGCDGFALVEAMDKSAICIVSMICNNNCIITQCENYNITYIFGKPVRVQDLRKRFDLIFNRGMSANNTKHRRISDEHYIHNILIKCGVPVHIKGFRMLISATLKVSMNHEIIHNVTNDLYKVLAEEFGTTWIRVERNIRTAIEATFNRGNIEFLNDIFGYTIDSRKGKPTNSEFIAMIADKVCLRSA